MPIYLMQRETKNFLIKRSSLESAFSRITYAPSLLPSCSGLAQLRSEVVAGPCGLGSHKQMLFLCLREAACDREPDPVSPPPFLSSALVRL